MKNLMLGQYHLATFNHIHYMNSYVDYLVNSLSNNYTKDTFSTEDVPSGFLKQNKQFKFKLYFQDILIAAFRKLSALDDFLYFIVKVADKNYTHESFKITQLKEINNNKTEEEVLTYDLVIYWLDNGFET